MKSVFAIFAVLASANAFAADAFRYDHQLALDLSQAYLVSLYRHNIPGALTLAETPLISSAIAAHGRHLVFVTYAGGHGAPSSYVELELCAETNLLTIVDVGSVDNIAAYRSSTAHITSKVYVASPAVCPNEMP